MSDPWTIRHDALNAAFDSGSVVTATQKELEQFLITTSEATILGPPNQARNERRAHAIRHLLQVRVTERIANRSFLVSVVAIVISFLAAAISVLRGVL